MITEVIRFYPHFINKFRMNRSHLSGVLRAAVGRRGYTAYADHDDRMAQTVASYPAAWLTPLKLLSSDGRSHGTAVYEASVRLLRQGHRLTPDAEQAARCRMEEELVDLFTELSNDARVIAVERLTVRPDTFSRSDGCVAMTATAQIVTHF